MTVSNGTMDLGPASFVPTTTSLVQYSAYSILGGLSLLINSLFMAVIMLSPRLRQRVDVVIYAGLAFADAVMGLGTMLQGTRRLWLISTNQFSVFVNAWYCMTTVCQTPVILGTFLAPLMYLSVSVDRLYCVCTLTSYPEYSRRYAALQLGLPFGLTAVVLAVGWSLASTQPTQALVFTIICFTDSPFPLPYSVLLYVFEAVVGVCSCVLYVVTMIAFHNYTNKGNAAEPLTNMGGIKRQVSKGVMEASASNSTIETLAIKGSMEAVSSIGGAEPFNDQPQFSMGVVGQDNKDAIQQFGKEAMEPQIGVIDLETLPGRAVSKPQVTKGVLEPSGKGGAYQSLAARKKSRQAKVTRNLAFIMLMTFGCSVIPSVLKAITSFIQLNPAVYGAVTPYFGALSLLNSLLNAAFYWARQVEVRTESLRLITVGTKKIRNLNLFWINNTNINGSSNNRSGVVLFEKSPTHRFVTQSGHTN